ncbi:MAG TPA: DoxX family protein [Planctomycetes bacterium]|nr:DoxX family protein [Planctomycetota bacterium]|tara:strand:- start:97 stop:504 length:408 start_codon:yes stop_codon:yes gene_type:complete
MRNWGLLLLRVVAGFGLAYGHGWGKMAGLMEKGADHPFVGMVGGWDWPAPLFFAWGAAAVEGVCGLLVAIGLWTRLSSFACGVTMVVAFVMVHFGSPWDKDAGGELAFIYMACFLAIAAVGPGALSIDARRGRQE